MRILLAAVLLLELVLAGAAQNTGGTIAGQIRTPAGAAAVGVRVAAMRADSAAVLFFGGAKTDVDGRYRLEGLSAGPYYVVAGPVGGQIYHPGLDSQAGATIVTVGTTAMTGLDFVVKLARVLPPPVVSPACRNGPAPIDAPSQSVATMDFVELERTAPTVRIGAQERRVTTTSYQRISGSLRDLIDDTERLADTHRWIHGDPQKELLNEALRESGGKPGRTPLMQAAAVADVDDIQKALAAKADPNSRDSSGWTALFYAAQGVKSGQIDAATYSSGPAAMKMLLDAGADPNARSFMDQTPLMSAVLAFYSPLDRVKLLIAAGANINAQDKNGKTVLMHLLDGALTNGRMHEERIQLCSLLRAAGARTDLRDAAGLTVFDLLAAQLAPFIAPPQPGEVRWWDADVIESRAVEIRQSLQN